MPTRRNSAYEKIKRIIKTNEHITVVLVTSRNAPQPLSPEEVDVLTELSKLLSPFEDAFLSVSKNTNVSVSIIIPVICKLFHKIKALDGKLKTVEGIFALDVVKSRLRERLLPYESRTNPGIATLLDSRLKKQGFLCQNNCEEASKALQEELNSTLVSIPRPQPAPPTEEPTRFLFLKSGSHFRDPSAISRKIVFIF